MANGDRTLSITIVATSEKAQKELAKLGSEADRMGLRVGAASEKVAAAGHHTEEYGHRTTSAFNAVQTAASTVGASLGPLGEILERVTVGMEHTNEGAGRVRRAFQVMGAAAAAVGGIITIEAAQDQAAVAQLKNAVENTGHSWEEYAEELEKTSSSMARFGHSNKDATEALTLLTAAFNDPKRAMDEMGLAADVAAREHTSLADAAQKVAAIAGGNMKALRAYGIQIRDLVDPAKEAAAAQKDLAASSQRLASAQEALANFEANLNAQRAAGEEAHASRVQAAQQKLADAQQHLTDVDTRGAEARKAAQDSANEAVASSTQKLTDARQNLADVEARIHQATQLSLQDAFSLRDAQQSLSDVQQKIADGQLAGADAAMALRDAQQRVSDTQALQSEKTKVSTSDQAELQKAQEAATKAADAQAAAVAKARTAGGETTAQHEAHRDALAGVADAHGALAKAQASGSGGETLRQLQEEKKLRDAVADAIAKHAAAEREVQKAKDDEAEYTDKVTAALDAWQKKVAGSADAASHTITGVFRRALADIQNFFAGLGPTVGFALVGLSAAIDIFSTAAAGSFLTALGGMFTGALAEIGAFVSTTVIALLPIEVGILPIIAVVAAVGIAAYELYRHWHQVWGFIKDIVSDGVHFVKDHLDWVIAVAFGPFGIAIKLIKDHWDSIWGAIKTSASGIGGFFKSAFSTVEGVVLAPFRAIVSVLNSVIDMIDSIHFSFHAPSWAGGFGWDFKGFGIPRIPAFADGGIVPGMTGAPVLVMAHGGEEIRNPAQMRSSWGTGGGAAAVVHVTIDARGALFPDQRSLQKLGDALTDSVHTGLLKKQERQPLNFTGRRQ